jgi:hypothetical protein
VGVSTIYFKDLKKSIFILIRHSLG